MKLLLMLLTSLLLVSCTEKKRDFVEKPFTYMEEQQVEQREIKEITIVDSLNLDALEMFTPGSLVKSAKGVIFLDRANRTIVQTDNDLNIISEFEIPEGRGPGELGGVRLFDYKDGRLAFVDNSLKKISHYSLEGKFLDEFKVAGVPYLGVTKIIDDNKYLIESTFNTDSLYHMIDSNGNVLQRIQSSEEADNPMMFTAQIKVTESSLYLAGYSEPVIKKYNLENGSLIYSKEMIDSYETTDNYMSFSNEGGFSGAGFTEEAIYGSFSIAVDQDLFYTARYHNGDKEYKFVDVYNTTSGEYQFSYLLDGFINTESLVIANGYLFSIEHNSAGEYVLMKYALQ